MVRVVRLPSVLEAPPHAARHDPGVPRHPVGLHLRVHVVHAVACQEFGCGPIGWPGLTAEKIVNYVKEI